MGLDMYLRNKDDAEIAYWRKANAIHRWFCDRLGIFGNDHSDEWINKEILEDLLSDCRKVVENPNDAPIILPTMDGFFFGDVTYGELYFSNIEQTINQLTNILSTFDFDNDDLYYEAYW